MLAGQVLLFEIPTKVLVLMAISQCLFLTYLSSYAFLIAMRLSPQVIQISSSL